MTTKVSFLACAAVLGSLGLAAGPVAASGVRLTASARSVSPGHAACSWHGHERAGTICIDGRSTQIRAGHGLQDEVVRAFRRAGYHASCGDGGVVVHAGRRRPRVTWSAQGWGMSVSWRGDGCLILRASALRCGSCSGGHGHGHGWHGHGHGDRRHIHPDREHRKDSGRRWPGRRPNGC